MTRGLKKGQKPKNYYMLHSPEANRKRSQKMMGNKCSVGKRSQAIKDKMRLRINERAANWRGGVSKQEGYSSRKGKEWTEKNRQRKNHLNLQRHARKKGARGSHTFGEWELLKKQYGNTCPACQKKEPEIKLTEDHIIPLAKGGSDYLENIQPLCKSCNSKKRTKIIKY